MIDASSNPILVETQIEVVGRSVCLTLLGEVGVLPE